MYYTTCTSREGMLLEKIDSFNDSCVIFSENLNAVADVIENKRLLTNKVNLAPTVDTMEKQISMMEDSHQYVRKFYGKQGFLEKKSLQVVLKVIELTCVIGGAILLYLGEFYESKIGFAALATGWGVGQIAHTALLKRTCKLELYQQGEGVLAKTGLIELSIAICRIIKKIQHDKEINLKKQKRMHRSINSKLICEFSELRKTINKQMQEVSCKYKPDNLRFRSISVSSRSSSGDVDDPMPASTQSSSEH